jgi:hypothetical protein
MSDDETKENPLPQDPTDADSPQKPASETLLDYMLRVILDETLPGRRRDSMARNAAYLMGQLRVAAAKNPTETMPEEKPLTGDELTRRIAYLLGRKKQGGRRKKQGGNAT